MTSGRDGHLNGRELSKLYFFEQGLPLLHKEFPQLTSRVAAGLLSGEGVRAGGSEAAGFDDEISRDHNWGPRFFLIMTEQDRREFGADVQAHLNAELPDECHGFRLPATSFPPDKCCVVTPEAIAQANVGFAEPPRRDADWLAIPEHRLFELTSGFVFYEPTPLITPVLDRFAYYPDSVWRKRLAFVWFSLALGANGFRTARRGSVVSTQMFVAWMLECVMRAAFLLRRRYAPHRKWLFHAFTLLPGLPPGLVEKMEQIATHLDLATVEAQMLDILVLLGAMANESDLITPVPLDLDGDYPFGAWNHITFGFVSAFEATLMGDLKGDPFHGPLDLWGAHFLGLTTQGCRAYMQQEGLPSPD